MKRLTAFVAASITGVVLTVVTSQVCLQLGSSWRHRLTRPATQHEAERVRSELAHHAWISPDASYSDATQEVRVQFGARRTTTTIKKQVPDGRLYGTVMTTEIGVPFKAMGHRRVAFDVWGPGVRTGSGWVLRRTGEENSSLIELTIGSRRVIWLGTRVFPLAFMANTVLYATMAFGAFTAPGLVRTVVRRRRGRCVTCGHLLVGASTCPECGAAEIAK